MYLKNKNVNNKNKIARSRKKYLVAALLTLLVAAGAFGGYWKFGHKNTASTQANSTANSETKGEQASDTKDSSDNGSGSSPTTTDGSGKAPTNPVDTSAPLTDPTGNFVSNHHPNLGGSPAPNTMQSSCNTTPGATCQITFTNNKDGSIKTLTAQKTDSGGATYWNYTLQSAGLTQGSWKIKATATLGSQTKSATDAMTLEVQE